MALTVQMIESKEFSRAAMGYNRKEVDEFLDEICDEMDRLHEEIAGLQMRLSKAGQTQVFKTHPGAVPAPSAAAPAFVPAPIEVVEETEAPEEKEPAVPQPAPVRRDTRPAAPVREEPKEEPRTPVEPIIREAKDSLVSQNKRLSEEKAALEKSIESLKTSASDYRTRLQALLTGQQKVLDDAADLF